MKKTILFSTVFLSLIIVISAVSPCIKMSEDISNKVFRLHILANSDADYDQKLKLRVRDEVLKDTSDIFINCKSVNDAVNVSKENINLIKKSVSNTINNCGYNYAAKVKVTKEYFNTRKYDNFTLPAGIYDCLKIEIGQGKGKNWWCVMFPSVCISGCTSDFDEILTDEEIKLIESDRYVIRFKAVEIYERLKNRLQ